MLEKYKTLSVSAMYGGKFASDIFSPTVSCYTDATNISIKFREKYLIILEYFTQKVAQVNDT